MRAFSLDPALGIPVKLQLKAHIRYQIMAGILRPGDQLPPLRDLAAGLGINLNTVVRAIAELEAAGFVYSHQGRGVFVADEFPGQGHGAALRSLLAGVLSPAREWGFSAEEMAMSMLAHGQLARPPEAAPYRLLLVGGSRPQLRRLQGELEGALPAMVEPVLAEEMAERVRSREYPVAATTLFHAGAVRLALPGATVVTLASRPAQVRLAEAALLPPGAPVAILSRDLLHAARVRSSLEAGGLGRLALQIGAGQTPAALLPALQGARLVLVTPDCREIAREALASLGAAPGSPELPLLAEPVELPAEALEELRAALGAPSGVQRVHVRSAWV